MTDNEQELNQRVMLRIAQMVVQEEALKMEIERLTLLLEESKIDTARGPA